MKAEYIVFAVAVLLVTVLIIGGRRKRRGKKLDPEYFHAQWRDLQRFCATRKTWPQAIVEADNLLHEALKRRGYKGKSMGEKLVSAQRDLTNNEAVWFGHKLSKRIPDEDVRKLRKQDVLEALQGFRQAMRDIGALEVKIDDKP